MEKSQYFLVFWLTDKKYSVISRAKLTPEYSDLVDSELIGQRVKALWTHTAYECEIKGSGQRKDLTTQLKLMTQALSDEIGDPDSGVSQIGRVLDQVLDDVQPLGCVDHLIEIQNLKEDLERQRNLTSKYKNRAKVLKRKLKEQRENNGTDGEIDIGNGTFIPKSKLDLIMNIADEPTKLARNIIKAVFTEAELIGHSLFATKCNANKNFVPRPEIDPNRRDAVLGFVFNKYELEENSKQHKKQNKLMRREVKNSILDLLRKLNSKGI